MTPISTLRRRAASTGVFSTQLLEVGSILGSLVVALPIVAVVWLAFSSTATDPAAEGALAHLLGTVLPRYTLTTAKLAAMVLVVVLWIGVSTGWLVAAYDFPGRRALAWMLVLPLSTPAFVMAYAYTDFLASYGALQRGFRALTGLRVGEYWFPDVHSWPAAGLFLGLALYPYVYLLARAAFADRSPSLADAARSLGMSRRRAWWRITWPVARPAVVAGCALALMETLADFGTVAYFSVDSFTAGIYRAWQAMGDRVGAARLATMLLVLVVALLLVERGQRGRMQFHVRNPRPAPRVRLRRGAALRATVMCTLPILFGFALPATLLVVEWIDGGAVLDARLPDWIRNTAILAGGGVLVVLPGALLATYAARLGGAPMLRAALMLANTGYALPGVVLGVGLLILSGWADRMLAPLAATFGVPALFAGGSAVACIYAYAVRFFPVAYQSIESGLARIGPSMDQSARSLGRRPLQVLREIHWPLMRRSVGAAALLVFIDCLKELPATLVLRPFDFDTLAVVTYQFASDERLAEAALPALMIVVVGAIPVVWLSRVALSEKR